LARRRLAIQSTQRERLNGRALVCVRARGESESVLLDVAESAGRLACAQFFLGRSQQQDLVADGCGSKRIWVFVCASPGGLVDADSGRVWLRLQLRAARIRSGTRRLCGELGLRGFSLARGTQTTRAS
jgi:hypothetical protein